MSNSVIDNLDPRMGRRAHYILTYTDIEYPRGHGLV